MEAVIKDVRDIDIFCDKDHDVLYISFGEVQEADDSELTDNDVVVRYRKGRIIGVTVLEFSKRPYTKIWEGPAGT
ncbi:MAG: hypothetical protein AVW05_02830 [Hadesarchaea archaeon DG-33]|nr:MAG: hypothetical protein AVW05_02830 [Hadesarchaea archaeon DG-33]